MKKPRIIYLHGNQTLHWSYGFGGWLKEALEQQGFSTVFETLPDSILAREQYWFPFLRDHIQAGIEDVLVGWSSGAVLAMRYAEQFPVKGSVLIAPCYTDLGEEMERLSGYYDRPWNWDAIRAHQDYIALLYGTNDPFIPQEEFHHIGAKLSADMIPVVGGEHFGYPGAFPEVLSVILARWGTKV